MATDLKQNIEPPRCPVLSGYHSDAAWSEMKQNDPESWAQAVAFDAAIRDGGTLNNKRDHQYVHRSLVPLKNVDLSTAEDHGQMTFLDECDGMCGI